MRPALLLLLLSCATPAADPDDRPNILYDLESDPDEMKDRAGDAACAKTLDEMRALHRRWLEATP